MVPKILYIKVDSASSNPSTYENCKWFFNKSFSLTMLDISRSKFESSLSIRNEIINKIDDENILLFGSIPYPSLNFNDWLYLRKKIRIGVIVGDSIQVFQNYFEYYTQFIDFAICIGEDDCNYYENSSVPAFHSPLLYDNVTSFHNNSNIIIPSARRTHDLIHLGRHDCGNRKKYLDNISRLNIDLNYFGKTIKNDIFTPLDVIINTAYNTKIAVVFSQPNHERTFSCSDYLWNRKAQNKGSFLQLMAAGCVVLAEYQPYLLNKFTINKDFFILENDYIGQIEKLLKNMEILEYVQENCIKRISEILDPEIEIDRARKFFINVLMNNNFAKNSHNYYVINSTFKKNFLNFNRPSIKLNRFRSKLYNTGIFSQSDIFIFAIKYILKKLFKF